MVRCKIIAVCHGIFVTDNRFELFFITSMKTIVPLSHQAWLTECMCVCEEVCVLQVLLSCMSWHKGCGAQKQPYKKWRSPPHRHCASQCITPIKKKLQNRHIHSSDVFCQCTILFITYQFTVVKSETTKLFFNN